LKRVIFYFDGFNFYNGLREKSIENNKWKNYYWIDFVKFCNGFLYDKTHELIGVKYFTAPPSNDKKRSRQSALFSANKLLNPTKFSVIKGQYQDKLIRCKLCNKNFMHPEEKRTDVSISVNMLLDCFNDNADLLILISADSDQIPTIQSIKLHFPKKEIKVYFPPCRNSTELLSIMKHIVFLSDNEDKFKNAVMPSIIDSGIKKYTQPDKWKF
jgi:uncharacterized LabA/DUF88 family protein